ncbi:MAG: DUF2163 domain-containing protein [Myxococcales bacterium]|nr:DUF2163 domain-containing protein [Myxococcales bacterium]
MSYVGLEATTETGKPIELYRFANLGEVFTYTSGNDDYVYSAETYLTRNILRNETAITSGQEPANLTLRIPADDEFVVRYRIGAPPSRDKLTIYRLHLTDTPTPEVVVFFKGEISSVAFQGDDAIVAAEPSGVVMKRPIPRRSYSNSCGHVLYDRGCKINENNALFKFDVTVQTINGSAITVNGAGIGVLAANYFVAGFLDKATTERRMILGETVVGPSTMTFQLPLPFASLAAGDTLVLRAGCNHSLTACRTKFNNVTNFGGFPWVPTENPFSTGIE